MQGTYYSTKVRPYIKASDQHSAFTDRNALFEWTAIEIPKGTPKLISVVANIRPKGDANATINNFGIGLFFADDDRTTFASAGIGSNQSDRPSRDMIGAKELSVECNILSGTNSSVCIQASGPTIDADHGNFDPLVFRAKDGLDANTAGYNTIYVAGLAKGAIDWTSINVINDTDINSTTPTAIVMAGTGMDVREHFCIDDVLHAQDDILLGTVASIDAAATGPINLTAATSGAGDATTVTNGDTIYNIHPLELVFNFEY